MLAISALSRMLQAPCSAALSTCLFPVLSSHAPLVLPRWYGADYSLGPLEPDMLAAMSDYPSVDAAIANGGAASDCDMEVAAADGGGGPAAGGGGAQVGWRAAMGQGAASDDGGAGRQGGSQGDEESDAGLPGSQMRRLRSISAPGAALAASLGSHEHGRQQQKQQAAGQLAPGPSPPRAGELHLPHPSWGLPSGVAERAARRAAAADWQTPPELLVNEPGLCCWHRLDTGHRLPKVGGAVL
jgi:hypothetical protein